MDANPNGEAASMDLAFATGRGPAPLTDELTMALRAAIGTGRAAGLEVTIYNPTLDADGSAGRALTTVLVDSLRPHAVPRAAGPGRDAHGDPATLRP